MPSAYSTGIMVPEQVRAYFASSPVNYVPSTVAVHEISAFAGAAIGSAVVSYPLKYAEAASPDMGTVVRLKHGSSWVFRGVIGEAPYAVDNARDEVVLVCYCDKWRMGHKTIGQIGIGTEGAEAGDDGWPDVGFDLVFNRDGRPNKDPSSRTFNTGSTAVYWTLETIMRFIFDNYISDDVARLSNSYSLGTPYDRTPNHVVLAGLTALQAVDLVAQMAGETWSLTPGSSYSTFTLVRVGSGTTRRLRLFRPRSGARHVDATQWHADRVSVRQSIRNSTDIYQAVSAPIHKEHTYSSTGDDPLLTRQSWWSDAEWVARYAVDVTAYDANNLGHDLSAGSQPKPWLSHLLTRTKTDSLAYVTAAELVATPALLANPQLDKPILWLATDGLEANARRVAGGARIDIEAGTVDLQGTVSLMADTGDDPEDVDVADWSTVGIWLTVVTILELPESAESDSGDTYLPENSYTVISKPDLVPERRQAVWLPDLAGDNNAVTKIAPDPDDEEIYVDISDKLADAVAAALAGTPRIETRMDVGLPFSPVIHVGDRISILGRAVGAAGNEVCVQVRYRVYEQYESSIRATNVLGRIVPEDFIRA